jgi:glycosyltransferase involved in cell wall biosynthesis
MRLLVMLNRRFVPRIREEGHPVGVAGFVQALVPALETAGVQVALATYERTPRDRLYVRYEDLLGKPSFCLGFSYLQDLRSVTSMFKGAAEHLCGDIDDLIFYHQSSATVALTPPEARCAITHHAPFVDDVVRQMGQPYALSAFGGGLEKLKALSVFQRRGIAWLRRSQSSLCVELSSAQRDRLVARGVPPTRCHMVPAPIEVAPPRCLQPSRSLHRWLSGGSETKLLIAAARLDGFKDIGGAVESLSQHISEGRIALFVAAGDASEEQARLTLRSSIASLPRGTMQVVPRWDHDQLVVNLRAAATKAIFGFPSSYETLGITPLEAMRCGMLVAVPDRPDRIGMLEYTTDRGRYADRPGGLADFLLRSNPGVPASGELLARSSPTAFAARFLSLMDRPSINTSRSTGGTTHGRIGASREAGAQS